MIAHKQVEFFISSILDWGKINYRTFPWRNSSNPYHFLIVEILLQKTKAEQVVEIFCDFIVKYPTLESLNLSNTKELVELIKPLGLYYRANRLKEIARQILTKFNGKIPENEEDLLSLKGVGKYIARAILCFGFGKRVSIMDVNVGRILIRYFGLAISKRIRDSNELWQLSENLLPNKKFREYNLYLLDFGSLICCKKKPNCIICPLNEQCEFFSKKY